jgi:hypothetical protein
MVIAQGRKDGAVTLDGGLAKARSILEAGPATIAASTVAVPYFAAPTGTFL